MRLPVPTKHEVRLSAWVVAIAAMLLTATTGWAIIHKVQQSDDVLHIAVTQADQVDRLTDQLDAQASDASLERARLKRQLRGLREQQRTLLRYLRAHGIDVPQTALTPRERKGGTTRPKASALPSPPSPSPTRQPSTQGSPGHTATPTPTGSPSGGIDLCALLNLDLCPLP